MVVSLKSLFTKFLVRLVDFDVLTRAYARKVDRHNNSLCVCSEGVSFGVFSRVINGGNRQSIRIGRKSIIDGELLIFPGDGNISIGEFSYIGENTKVWSKCSVIIGDDVQISHNVSITDSNAHDLDYERRASAHKRKLGVSTVETVETVETVCAGAIVIEDGVWINCDSVILKGVRIGKGAIVAAGSVVTKDVMPYTVVAGNPAVQIKSLV